MNCRIARSFAPAVAGLVVAAAIGLTGCPQRIDVAPEEDAPPAGDAPDGVGTEPPSAEESTATSRVRRSIPARFAAQRTETRPTAERSRVAAKTSDQSQPLGGYGHPEAVDPVKANGPIFVNWPQPQLAILFSGEQDGYLEPCGCAGLENQKGGLSRRHTLIKQLREKGWPVVALDGGGQIKRIGPQAELKLRHAVESLVTLGYEVVGLGASDLRAGLLGVAVNLDEEKNPLLSANTALIDFDSGFTKRYRVIEAGGKRIGVTSVLGARQQQGLQNVDTVIMVDPVQALREVVPQLRAEKCDLLVLLSHASPDETRQLARQFPVFDFVLTAGGAEEPPRDTEHITGTKSRMLEVGHKGMYVSVVGLYENDGKTTFRYQRVPLDARFPDSPEMHQMMVNYQNELRTIGLDGLGLTGTRHESGRHFVGTQKCAECHTEAMAIFEQTPHSYATERLVKLDPARHFDPECLSCHATGWNPQKYFPYTSGFFGLEKTPHMTTNGCENCHGPGSDHYAAETGQEEVDERERDRRRAEMRLALVENEGNMQGQVFGKVVENCMQCHDLDNSPDFDFQHYWPEVEHYGKE